MPIFALLAPVLSTLFSQFLMKAAAFYVSYLMIGFGIALSGAFFAACCNISLSFITNLFTSIPPSIQWFWELFNFYVVAKLIICAIMTKWMVRWIPFSPK